MQPKVYGGLRRVHDGLLFVVRVHMRMRCTVRRECLGLLAYCGGLTSRADGGSRADEARKPSQKSMASGEHLCLRLRNNLASSHPQPSRKRKVQATCLSPGRVAVDCGLGERMAGCFTRQATGRATHSRLGQECSSRTVQCYKGTGHHYGGVLPWHQKRDK